MVSYEVAMGLSLITVLMLAGNVTLPHIVAQQQVGLWYALPLSLGFILFVIAAFAETNRLPFDMPEAESELVTGYHTEYSAMKFSAFMISEFGHMVTASALMATLFLGGWDLPGTWDDAFWYQGQLIGGFAADGSVLLAAPAAWKTLLTFLGFAAKTGFFLVLYIWIRWTLPRFRYDQVMALGWKVMLPTALAYAMLMAGTILTLDEIGMAYGFGYGLALTAVSGVATIGFMFFLDRGKTITGAAAQRAQRVEVKTSRAPARVGAAGVASTEPAKAGS
jgi:NADH-quinone oxidoreductase subunit H